MKKLVALMLTLAMCLCLAACGESGGSAAKPEDIAEKYMEAIEDCDAEAMLDLMHEDIVDFALEEMDADKDEFIENLEELLEKAAELLEEGEWKVKKVKEIDDDDLEDLQDQWDDDYDLEVEEAALAKIEITWEEDGEENDETLEIVLVKIDGDWYLGEMGL